MRVDFLIYKNLEFSFSPCKFAKTMSKVFSIIKLLTNKFLIVTVVFLVAIFTTEEHNVVIRYENTRTIKQLEKELAFYKNKSAENKKRLEQLRADKAQIEKFAREKYRMHAPNEDVFIVE
jgi:cell division protein FtsB